MPGSFASENGQRKLKTQTFDGKAYKTESDVRRAVESQLPKLNSKVHYGQSVTVTFGSLLDRYIAEEIPPRKSTRDSYLSLIRNYLRPQWKDSVLAEIRPGAIHSWLQSLELAPISKGHIRALMKKLFDLAALWEYLPAERRNPVELAKVKNVTKRTKEPVVLTQDQFREVLRRLPPHVNMVAVLSGCLGLRVSEALGLKWTDIDWTKQTIKIQRSAYRGAIDDTKTESSNAKLPLDPAIAALLRAWQAQSELEFDWVFANPATGMPYLSPSLQQRWIRPAGEAIGVEGLGFHSLRHSYRSWLDAIGAAPGITKDLMRHSDIATTFNKYGRAMSEEKRIANAKVVKGLLTESADEATG